MKLLRIAILLSVFATLSVALPAAASSASWTNSSKLALPSNDSGGIYDGQLSGVVCPSASTCVAVGDYETSSVDVAVVILTESKGVWTSSALKMPANALTGTNANGSAFASIGQLSCGSVGNCAAVGSYADTSDNTDPFVASEVNGAWSVAREVTLPSNATSTEQTATMRSVDCPSAGNCSAVGTYLDNNTYGARTLTFVVSETSGVWQLNATPVNAPGSAPTNFNPFFSLGQVDCSSAGNCVAVGSYTDASDVTQGLIVNEVKGTWTSSRLALPTNASSYADASLSAVTCVKNSCSVLGSYATSTGALEGLAASETNGQWSKPVEIPMPTNAGTNPTTYLYGFSEIACASNGNCSAGGQYRDASGNYQGFFANETAGTWKRAVQLPLPTGASQAGKNGGVITIACPSAGNNYQALVINEQNGTWQRGTKIVLPGGATTAGIAGGVYQVACTSVNACTAVGSYQANSGDYEGFVLTN
jgi:cytochrome c551/c552